MCQEDFKIQPEDKQPEKPAHCCPFAGIPQTFWQNLLPKPFRKRHPFIFFGGWAIMLFFCVYGIMSLFKSDGPGRGEDCLALVNIQGPIVDASSQLAWIRKIERNPDVKGILLRVNSPGGGAASSQEIYAALARVGKKVPIAVSMGSTAASGGLMISMAGERIYANPSTITGSIGVRMDIPQLQGLMAKIGVGQETLTTAPYKDAASYTHPISPEDRVYLESVLTNMHAQFVKIVATGRKMPYDQAAALANGKIYTGEEALALGLVDDLGGEDEAWLWLSERCGVPYERKLLVKPREKGSVTEWILGELKSLFSVGTEAIWFDDLFRPAFLYQY